MGCEFNPFLRMVDNYHLCLLIIAFGFSLSLGNRKWAVLTGITACFYYLGYATSCEIVDWDTDKIWRYIIWLGLDFIWMITIYIAWKKNRIYQYQAAGAIFLGACSVVLQSFRFIDRHYLDLAYSTSIYTTMAPAFNNLLVLLCLYPLVTYLRSGMSKWQSQ